MKYDHSFEFLTIWKCNNHISSQVEQKLMSCFWPTSHSLTKPNLDYVILVYKLGNETVYKTHNEPTHNKNYL